MGFHAPQEAARVLAEAADYARQRVPVPGSPERRRGSAPSGAGDQPPASGAGDAATGAVKLGTQSL